VYVGLRPFEAADRHLFYGRSGDVQAVYERWSTQRLTVLSGPAGVGKTSLIQAEVVPLAAASGGQCRIVLPAGRIVPAAGLGPAVPGRNSLALALLGSWSGGTLPADPVPLSVPAYLNRLRTSAPRQAALPIFAVIDQFEHLFRDVQHEACRQDLLSQLVQAVQEVPELHLLVSVREDCVCELEDCVSGLEAMPGATGRTGHYRLAPLSSGAALEAVAGPAHATGRSYAPGVAAEVVRNLRASRIVNVRGDSRELLAETVEPAQLQAACSALWNALPAGLAEVSREHLYSPGDLDGGLVRFCERAVHDVAAAEEVPMAELWSWLVGTFVTDLGGRASASEGMVGVAGMPVQVARRLVDRYLLTTASRPGSRWYQLASDRLVAPVREVASRWVADVPVGAIRPAISLAAAEGALAEGNLALATQRAAEAVRTSGTDLHTRATALSCLGLVATQVGRDQEAESHYRAAAALFELVRDPTGAGRSLAGVGRTLLRRGRYTEAVAELQGAEARLPSDLAIHVDLARALRDTGQLLAATAVLGTVLTIAPGTVDALIDRGLIRIATGEFSAALDDLDNAIRIRPSVGQHEEIISARAFARARLGSPDSR
jgi:Flp pilus assembly protein TadD